MQVHVMENASKMCVFGWVRNASNHLHIWCALTVNSVIGFGLFFDEVSMIAFYINFTLCLKFWLVFWSPLRYFYVFQALKIMEGLHWLFGELKMILIFHVIKFGILHSRLFCRVLRHFSCFVGLVLSACATDINLLCCTFAWIKSWFF